MSLGAFKERRLTLGSGNSKASDRAEVGEWKCIHITQSMERRQREKIIGKMEEDFLGKEWEGLGLHL